MIPIIPANSESSVTLAARSIEIYGNSEYVESIKNFPTSSANIPELEVRILEIQQIHEVAKYELDDITQPTEIFTNTNKLDPTEIDDNKTTSAENH